MKKTIKKILLYSLGTFLFLVLVLAVHIYYVYRPAPDASTKAMARIDIKQQITQDDANKISAWMYRQKGIDHVLVNPKTNIVVFTFFPVKTMGDKIANAFKASFPLKAERFLPSGEQMKSGCPVASTSYTYKMYKLITQII
jgi:cbb3-type cytochrome oxidase subunit 3